MRQPPRHLLRCASVAAALLLAAPAFAAGDPDRGKAVFARCSACHALAQDRIGPHLAGVVGRTAGSAPGFRYSAAMKAYARPWSEPALDAFLASPAKAVPGSAMMLGLDNPADRTDVISYLKTAR